MDLQFTNDDFRRLNKIQSINHNKKLFDKSIGYTTERTKQEVFEIQQPVFKKMQELSKVISTDPYFNRRFEVKLCRRTKQSTRSSIGPYRPIIWISLVPNSVLNQKKDRKYSHQKLPQIQIWLRPERFVVASIWLEGKVCEQKYRLQLFNYLQKHRLQIKYTVTIDNKKDDHEKYNLKFEDYSDDILKRAKKNKYFSIGVERRLDKNKVVKEGEKIYQSILNETEEIYKKIFLPCFGFKDIKQEKRKAASKGRYTRRGSTSDKISKYFRKSIPRKEINPRHRIIQRHLKRFLQKEYKWIGEVHNEKNFIDLSVEYKREKKSILYEIKIDDSALKCLKNGLGQLLFYSLITKEYGQRSIELVIVGLQKIKWEEEKKFIKLLKKILGETKFRYQVFDEKKKELLAE